MSRAVGGPYVTKLTQQEKNFDRARGIFSETRAKLADKRCELARYFPSTENAKVPSQAFDPFGEGYDFDGASGDPFR